MLNRIRNIPMILTQPLTGWTRLLVLAAAVALVPTYFWPLWQMDFWAQQYPEGLQLFMYSHNLVGGNDGNDLTEINVLNHYIGMAPLIADNFVELKWVPLVVGFILILTLRAAAIGTMGSVVDILVISLYFGLFSMWSFAEKLGYYGSHLDPKAAVTVDPFTPPLFGHNLVGQFEVWSFPAKGAYAFAAFGLLLVVGLVLSWRARVR